MSENDFLNVSKEFLNQNLDHTNMKKSRNRGGPYSKNDKDERMNEVYRLHFDYGYSARKIAEMMKVNRNTINGDINYWFSQMAKDIEPFKPEKMIIIGIGQMKIQLTRLRQQLDKVNNNSERMALERMIYDINCKIMHTHEKLSQSAFKVHQLSTKLANDFMKKNKKPERFITWFETMSVSQNAEEKIRKIIKEDVPKRNLKKKF